MIRVSGPSRPKKLSGPPADTALNLPKQANLASQAETATAAYQPRKIERLYSPRQTAAILDCSVKKLEKDRQLGRSIPFVKVGRLVKYRESDIADYIALNRHLSTTEYGDGA